MALDFRNYTINNARPLTDAKPAAWKLNIASDVSGDATTGGTGGLFWQLSHSATIVSTLTKTGNVTFNGWTKVGRFNGVDAAGSGLPTAASAGAGAILYSTFNSKLYFSDGTNWHMITST